MLDKLRDAARLGLAWRLLGSVAVLALAWLSWAFYQLLLGDFSPAGAGALTALAMLLLAVLGGVLLTRQPHRTAESSAAGKGQELLALLPTLAKISGRQVLLAKLNRVARRHSRSALLVSVLAGLLVAMGPQLSRAIQQAVDDEDEPSDQ